MKFTHLVYAGLAIVAALVGYFLGAGSGDPDPDPNPDPVDPIEATVDKTRAAFLGPLVTIEPGYLNNGAASSTVLTPNDRTANPCFWCMAVTNQSGGDPLYDCTDPCPCAESPVDSQEIVQEGNPSIFALMLDVDQGGSGPDPDQGHQGDIIIDSYFNIVTGTGFGLNNNSSCLRKNENESKTTFQFYYTAEVADCENANKSAFDEVAIFLNNATGPTELKRTDVKNAPVQRSICDNICYVSTLFEIEVDNTLLTGQNSVDFLLAVKHGNTHLSQGSHPGASGGGTSISPTNIAVTTAHNPLPGTNEHELFLAFTMNVCP